jgi:hypothetical protein
VHGAIRIASVDKPVDCVAALLQTRHQFIDEREAVLD